MAKEKLILPDQLISSGDFLSNFIEVFPSPAHVKDMKTGKYLLSNQTNVEIYGLKSTQDLVGLTVRDLDGFMHHYWGNVYARIVEKLDYQARVRNSLVNDERVILTNAGFVRLQKMVKIPVLGTNRKVIAVFTFSHNLTHKIDLFHLFNLYKKHYPKKQAIEQFLRHLNMWRYFMKMPTEAEIFVLLAMRRDDSHKSVAKLLHIEPKTVEIHSSHLRNKLKGVNLNKLLIYLRNELKH